MILEIKDVSKKYGTKVALQSVNFQVEKGSFVGLLGENGAGKSTLLNIIANNLKQDQGYVYYDGELIASSNKCKSELGIVYQNSILDKSLTVYENLYVRGSLYELSKEEIKTRIKQLSNDFDLNSILKQRYGTLSGGQKRKVDIARALLHQPKLLILDEPTTGLDPDIRKTLWMILTNLRKKNNLTILLTTHYMEETNDCDKIIMLDKGILIKEGTPNDLKIMFSNKRLVLYTKNLQELQSRCKALACDYIVDKDKIVVFIENSFDSIEIVSKCKDVVESFEVINGTMDDMFLKIKKGGNK